MGNHRADLIFSKSQSDTAQVPVGQKTDKPQVYRQDLQLEQDSNTNCC